MVPPIIWKENVYVFGPQESVSGGNCRKYAAKSYSPKEIV